MADNTDKIFQPDDAGSQNTYKIFHFKTVLEGINILLFYMQ
jgi:hypothetical protein